MVLQLKTNYKEVIRAKLAKEILPKTKGDDDEDEDEEDGEECAICFDGTSEVVDDMKSRV